MSKHTISHRLFYPQNKTLIKKILDKYILPEILELVLLYLILDDTATTSNQHVILFSDGMSVATREQDQQFLELYKATPTFGIDHQEITSLR